MAVLTPPIQSREVLLDAGCSNIEVGGCDWLGCSEDDALRTKFKATGPTGRKVEGVVCAGMFFKARPSATPEWMTRPAGIRRAPASQAAVW